ncbi:MAG: hypothetical protein JRI96_14485 [Deltaproteobacteria bacterium]|nr:hypothetical protein [Deltaproteobacteria bacterium]
MTKHYSWERVGLVGGTLGSLLGIIGGILGGLCGRNRKKYQGLMLSFLYIITSAGAIALLLGLYAYLTKFFHPSYRYGLTLCGVIFLFAGGLNLIIQTRYKKQIEDFKDKVSKIE